MLNLCTLVKITFILWERLKLKYEENLQKHKRNTNELKTCRFTRDSGNKGFTSVKSTCKVFFSRIS